MNTLRELNWPLLIILGVLGLARPLARITFEGTHLPPVVIALSMTGLVTIMWALGLGLARAANPLLGGIITGLIYALGAIILSGILSPILNGHLDGPLGWTYRSIGTAGAPVALGHADARSRPIMTENRSRRGGRMWGLILGAAVLGFIGGVLAAIVLNDLVAGLWPEALRVIAPLSLPAGAIVGAFVTGVLAHRRLSLSD